MQVKEGYETFRVMLHNIDNNASSYSGLIHANMSKLRAERKRKRKVKRTKWVATIITGALALYGASNVYSEVKSAVSNKAIQLENERIALENSLKPVAYTDYSDAYIKSMSFYELSDLYNDYITYVESNASNVVIDTPDMNYSRYKTRALECVEEVKICEGVLDEESLQKLKNNALELYRKAIQIIDQLYNGKYSLNNVTDESIVVMPQEQNQSRSR